MFDFPKSWSPDGRYLIYAQVNPVTGSADLFALPLEGDRKPVVLADSSANEDQGQFSPDGHWVAYTSNESGLSEIYVIPFDPHPAAADGRSPAEAACNRAGGATAGSCSTSRWTGP